MSRVNIKEPEIRFPGFTSDWEQRKLKDLTERVTGNDGRMDLPTLTISAANGWMDQRDRFSGNIAGKEQKNYTLLSKGMLSYNHGNSKLAAYGTVFVLEDYEEALVPRVYHSFKTNDLADANYLEILFASKIPDQELRKIITSGARMDGLLNISYDDFENIKIPIPEMDEQLKISSFFRQVDETITLHQQKLDDLKNLKSGLLQKMFPQKGEKVPQIRFPGFTGDWEQRQLGDIATFINGRAYSQDELLEKGKYKVLRVGNFYTNDSWYYSDLELEENKYADTGDLLYTWSATFGPHIWDGGKVIYHYHIWKVDLSEELDKLFALQLLERDKSQLLNNSNGSTMIHITKKNMEDKLVYIPQVEEQEKIGQFFKKVDQTITLHQQKIDDLNQLKSGLLQKMFP